MNFFISLKTAEFDILMHCKNLFKFCLSSSFGLICNSFNEKEALLVKTCEFSLKFLKNGFSNLILILFICINTQKMTLTLKYSPPVEYLLQNHQIRYKKIWLWTYSRFWKSCCVFCYYLCSCSLN